LTFHPNQAEARMERSGNHTSSFAVIQLSKTRLLGQRPPFYVRELRLSTRNPFSRPARTRRRRGGCAPCTPVPRGLRYPSTASAARQHACTTIFRGIPGSGLKAGPTWASATNQASATGGRGEVCSPWVPRPSPCRTRSRTSSDHGCWGWDTR